MLRDPKVICSYEHTRRTTKNFPLPCIGVSMYTTRFVYKNGGTPNAKTCGAPTQSKKIRTSPSSLLFLKSDIHLPIISNEKRGSCFLRLHSSNSKEQENLVHSYCENLQRTIQNRRTALFTSLYLFSVFPSLDVKDSFAATNSLGISDSKMVGAYLPESSYEEGFYQFSADSSKTPALRYLLYYNCFKIFYFLVPEPSIDIVLAFHRVGKNCQ